MMVRPRSNSLSALPDPGTLAPEISPPFLGSRALTDIQTLGSSTLVSRGPSSHRPRLELDTSLPENEQGLSIERPETIASTEFQQDLVGSRNEIENLYATQAASEIAPNIIWERKNLLTCDGGGIRGYATLLLIAELMKYIGRIEREHHEPHITSFAPFFRPPVPVQSRKSTFGDEGSLICEYLPCHYFDYMVGTSTGGLIAIMLSRWRMSVAECLAQYQAVGPNVFGLQRSLSIVGFPHDKYHKAPLVNIIQQLTRERTPENWQGDGDRFRLFPAPSDLCRCAVVANEETKERSIDHPHLFRTYKVTIAPDTPLHLQPRDWETQDNHEIWEVCRATTAAPTFFRPAKIGDKTYSDGGVGTNNPTFEAIDEIDKVHGPCLDNVASFGTGMPPKYSAAKKKLGLAKFFQLARVLLKSGLAGLTDCEKTHQSVLSLARRDGTFQYFRFNIEEGLGKVSLDEWKEKSDRNAPGGKYTTFDMLREHTQVELQKTEVQNNLRNLAKLLVRRRRERAKDENELGHWERFACCTTYRCPDERCRLVGEAISFDLRSQMREHLNSDHPNSDYRHMTPAEVRASMKARLDECRHLPEYEAGPY